jgi:hypothetical protein
MLNPVTVAPRLFPGFPRVIVVEIQHANPYSDDSYAVNSANLGPYGDAIMKELVGSGDLQPRRTAGTLDSHLPYRLGTF